MTDTDNNIMELIPVMTIAGSDCSSGAGLQADLKTFQHFGLHGLTAVTCIVAETANTVRRIDVADPSMVEDQIRLLLDSFPVGVVKTGMLCTAEHVRRVAAIFREHPEIRLVIDPVMVASTGANLLEPDAVQAYKEQLLPLSYVITPNLPEAETLLGQKIVSLQEMEEASQKLSQEYGCAVLLKGGHLGGETCTDLLFHNDKLHSYTSPRLDTPASHGTGCTLAAATASCLALGHSFTSAVAVAKDYLDGCLNSSYSFTSSSGEKIHALNQGTFRV